MNYASLIREILDIGIHQTGINMCFDGDIYQLNNMQAGKFPVFVCAPTEPQIEHEQYFEYVLTLYYIDREQYSTNQYNNADISLIHSAGIQVLSNIIKKIRKINDILDIDDVINYTCWTDTEILADKCNGVYCTIHIKVPKETNCVSD